MLREKIIKEISKQGLTVYRLSKLTGISITQVNNYLKGKYDMTGCNIDKLLKALGVYF